MKLNDIVTNEPIASILQQHSPDEPLHVIVTRERLAVNNPVQHGKYITTHQLCDINDLYSVGEFIRYKDEVLCATFHAMTWENRAKLFTQRPVDVNSTDPRLLCQRSTLIFRVSEINPDVYEVVIVRTPLTDPALVGKSFILAKRDADCLYLI